MIITPTPSPTPSPSPTPPPPTEVPSTGSTFSNVQEWQAAQAVDPIEATLLRAAAQQNAAFHLKIPAINLITAVTERGWKQVKQANGALVSEWEDVNFAAGWHKNSTIPGRQGNVVVSGHNNVDGAVFRDLWQLDPGATIYVDQGRVRYTYVIDEVTIEPETNTTAAQQAENAAFLNQTNDNRLTLITCWPWNDSTHRVFVVAMLKNIQMTAER